MIFDYSKLRGKIREMYNTESNFAEALKTSGTSLSGKLNNRVDFTQDEIMRSVELLNIEVNEIPQYFFTTKVKEA